MFLLYTCWRLSFKIVLIVLWLPFGLFPKLGQRKNACSFGCCSDLFSWNEMQHIGTCSRWDSVKGDCSSVFLFLKKEFLTLPTAGLCSSSSGKCWELPSHGLLLFPLFPYCRSSGRRGTRLQREGLLPMHFSFNFCKGKSPVNTVTLELNSYMLNICRKYRLLRVSTNILLMECRCLWEFIVYFIGYKILTDCPKRFHWTLDRCE
jgi:hypothetical protein